MAELCNKSRDKVIVFVYNYKSFKSFTNPEFIPQVNDGVIIDGSRYDVKDHVVDINKGKIFIYLG